MTVAYFYEVAEGVTDAGGGITLAFPGVPVSSVYTGTISVVLAPTAVRGFEGRWKVQTDGASDLVFQGLQIVTDFQRKQGQTVSLIGGGLIPGQLVSAVWQGIQEPYGSEVPKGPSIQGIPNSSALLTPFTNMKSIAPIGAGSNVSLYTGAVAPLTGYLVGWTLGCSMASTVAGTQDCFVQLQRSDGVVLDEMDPCVAVNGQIAVTQGGGDQFVDGPLQLQNLGLKVITGASTASLVKVWATALVAEI